MTGRVLVGRYEIIDRIGKGGMAYVYRALDRNTQKLVAVKVLREEFNGDADFIKRFEREAIAASKMTHPNIVNLLDVGVDGELRFIVIEYVSGKTLKEFVRETGGLRDETAGQIAIRVLAALQHAHQNGIIHRDIKPQNILIDREGVVKVTDFGIARMVSMRTELRNEESNVGSVHYFSPEQAKGEPADEKSDIYSAGVVLYEMLTGQVPFQGEEPVAIALQHIQDAPVPPVKAKPGVSPALSKIAVKAMAKQAKDRYATASDMIQDIKNALRKPAAAAAPKQQRSSSRAAREAKRMEAAQRRVRWMRNILAGIFALLLLAVVSLLVVTAGRSFFTNLRDRVVLPDVTNMTLDVARASLEGEKGLHVEVEYQVYMIVPENIVADQVPTSGTTLKRGDTVTLTVSSSQYDLTIPNITGLRLADAQGMVAEYGLIIGSQITEISEAGELQVIGQDPPPGTLANRGDPVHLRISGGQVVVPNMVGQLEKDALNSLAAANLVWGNTADVRTTDAKKDGRVVSQAPAPYTKELPGTPVELVMARLDPRVFMAPLTFTQKIAMETLVTVSVVLEDGTGEVQYRALHAAGSERAVTIMLRSAKAGEQEYLIEYEDIEIRGKLDFK